MTFSPWPLRPICCLNLTTKLPIRQMDMSRCPASRGNGKNIHKCFFEPDIACQISDNAINEGMYLFSFYRYFRLYYTQFVKILVLVLFIIITHYTLHSFGTSQCLTSCDDGQRRMTRSWRMFGCTLLTTASLCITATNCITASLLQTGDCSIVTMSRVPAGHDTFAR